MGISEYLEVGREDVLALSRTALRSLTDEDVVRAYLGNNPLAFEEIVIRYEVRLVNFVAQIIHDRERARDIIQLVFYRVSTHAREFSFEHKFSAWIYCIARNHAYDEQKHRSSAKGPLHYSADSILDESDLFVENHKYSPDRLVLQAELQSVIDKALAMLTPLYSRILRMYYIDGCDYEEIARITGMSNGSIKTRIFRGKAMLAARIKPYLD